MNRYDPSVLQTRTGGNLIALIKSLSASGRRTADSLKEARAVLKEYNAALKIEHYAVKASRNEVSNDTNI